MESRGPQEEVKVNCLKNPNSEDGIFSNTENPSQSGRAVHLS